MRDREAAQEAHSLTLRLSAQRAQEAAQEMLEKASSEGEVLAGIAAAERAVDRAAAAGAFKGVGGLLSMGV
jgi:hypothetical protein